MPGNQTNVEYWFRLIYEWFYGQNATLSFEGFKALMAHIWLWIIAIGYMLSIIGIFFIVYCTIRLFELRKREEEYYSTLIVLPDATSGTHPRWAHIESLLEGASESEWREAIIEADIMLDDTLARRGYVGDGVGEKLKAIEPKDLGTLQDAWEAHKVRNQIAHEGSSFELTADFARRTVAHYEAVFRELKVI